jgi:hypothetical protein
MQPTQSREGRRPVRRAALLVFAVFALVLASVPASAQIDIGDRWILLTGSWSPGAPDSPAWFDLTTWTLAVRFDGVPPRVAPAGTPSAWVPVAGDFDGDRVDSVMMFDPATWRLVPAEELPREGSSDPQPNPWVPVAGDWEGRGIDTVRVFDLRDASLHRLEEGPIRIGDYDPPPNPWRPLVGDFSRQGFDAVAFWRDGKRAGGDPDWAQVAGDWDGDGIDTFGAVFVPSGELVAGEPVELVSRSLAAPAVPQAPASIFAKGLGGSGTGCWSYITNYNETVTQINLGGGACSWIVHKAWQEWTCCALKPYGPVACTHRFKFDTDESTGSC